MTAEELVESYGSVEVAIQRLIYWNRISREEAERSFAKSGFKVEDDIDNYIKENPSKKKFVLKHKDEIMKRQRVKCQTVDEVVKHRHQLDTLNAEMVLMYKSVEIAIQITMERLNSTREATEQGFAIDGFDREYDIRKYAKNNPDLEEFVLKHKIKIMEYQKRYCRTIEDVIHPPYQDHAYYTYELADIAWRDKISMNNILRFYMKYFDVPMRLADAVNYCKQWYDSDVKVEVEEAKSKKWIVHVARKDAKELYQAAKSRKLIKEFPRKYASDLYRIGKLGQQHYFDRISDAIEQYKASSQANSRFKPKMRAKS